MRDSTEASYIDIELICFHRSVLFLDSLQYLALGPSPLSATDNLAIALRRQQIMAEYILRVIWIWAVVERLGNSRIVCLKVWDIEVGSEYFLL